MTEEAQPDLSNRGKLVFLLGGMAISFAATFLFSAMAPKYVDSKFSAPRFDYARDTTRRNDLFKAVVKATEGDLARYCNPRIAATLNRSFYGYYAGRAQGIAVAERDLPPAEVEAVRRKWAELDPAVERRFAEAVAKGVARRNDYRIIVAEMEPGFATARQSPGICAP